MKQFSFFTNFLFSLLLISLNTLSAQDKWYVTVTMAPTMTNEVYDGLFAKMGAAGLANCFSEYHAAGPNPAGGYFGFTAFSSKAQCDARLATLKPFLGGVSPMPYEAVAANANPNPPALTAKTVIVFFGVKGQTEAQYGQIVAGLEKAGALVDPNRLYHVAYKTPDGIKVIDVWKDAESFAAAGKTLMPIIMSTGVNPPPPVIVPVHAIRVPTKADKNIDAALSAYAAFGKGDILSILNMLTDDCDWSHVGNASVIPFAGTFTGKAGVGRFFENVGKSIQITKFEPGNFRATENSATCTVNIGGTVVATGKTYTNTVTQTFWFDGAGKVKKWATTGDVTGLEAAFVK